MLLFTILGLLQLASSSETKSITALLSQVPNCALPCVTTDLINGGCSLTKVSALTDCLCPNIQLQANLSTCVQIKCFFDDQTRAAQLQTELCAAYPKESRSNEAKVIAICLSVITFPVVGLRCLSRWLVTKQLWWDDAMVVIATVLLAAMAGVQIAGTNIGFGLHYWNVDPSASVKLIQLFYAGQQLYILVQVFAKISILLLFSRLFSASRWFQLTIRYFIGFLVLHGVVFMFVVIFECYPISSIWDLSDPNRSCRDITAIAYSGAGFSIVEDFCILLLPIPELLTLQLSKRKKAMVVFIFSLGSFACVTSMVRLKFLIRFSTTFDVTWDNIDIVIWSLVEVFCAILCASLPALRPLMKSLSKKFSRKDTEAAPLRPGTIYYRKNNFRMISETMLSTTDISLSPIDDTKIGDQIARELDWWDKLSLKRISRNSNKA
ncbi:integral membrane protein [Colletotrichum karsti]|uniref:Integral membrane protein n=1 Tax=Colletotrichum karsti TaxID=1095194 RepID=A0A9P6I9T3_9PEZI|nr:uncharacterized protein CkaCkLH20_03035 [Colletotrichum karsti]KAF9879492.1 integral membrane protein [Colletotrichum karsti]